MVPKLSISISRRPTARAFSLVELLVVISVLAILMTASVPALLSSQRSSALTHAGNTVADLANLARQTAQSKNTFSALVIGTKPSPTAKQALAVMEYDSNSESWKPTINWIRLSEAAQVDDTTPVASQFAPTNVAMGGANLAASDFTTLLFYPDGRMDNGGNAMRQIRAHLTSDKATNANNFYDVVVNGNTSAVRIVRP